MNLPSVRVGVDFHQLGFNLTNESHIEGLKCPFDFPNFHYGNIETLVAESTSDLGRFLHRKVKTRIDADS